MNIVITRVADLDPRGIACRRCAKLLASLDEASDRFIPSPEELSAAGAVAVPNFGWFCGQPCADAYERDTGVRFQRDHEGRVSYYPPPA